MKQRVTMKSLLHSMLKGSTALTLVVFGTGVVSGALRADEADCVLVDGMQTDACTRTNQGTAVDMPTGQGSEWDRSSPRAPEGFVLSIDGDTFVGDARIEDRIRATDLALEAADIQIRFDGLETKKRLDLEFDRRGHRVMLQSRLNYPGYISRAEMRVIDLAARGGPATVAVVPVAPNGAVTVDLPEGDNLSVIHRVYDAAGRYDETIALSLESPDDRGLVPGVEDGSNAMAVDRIPVRGGSVTVSGESVQGGAVVHTLGEAIRPDPSGRFVIQRILPPGDHQVAVSVDGASRPLSLSREVQIPQSEWFRFGVADLTLGRHKTDGAGFETYKRGRLSGYAKGITAGGYTITGSVDTQEEDLGDIFSMLDEKDPRSLLLRIDPAEYYPVYGDDSTFTEDAPTSGRFYLRVEKDGNYLMWGNGKSEVAGSEYLRNERMLYGLSGKWASKQQTSRGEPRVALSGYVAQPDNLPQRDVFRGTGGSVYFLSRQDISRGSETVIAELRDRTTGRVVSYQYLTYTTDYTINYVQGIVSLNAPLSSSASEGVVITNPGGDFDVNLIVQYEYTPVATDIDGYSTGGRVEAWATDDLRIGVTVQNETTGDADQKSRGVDLHYRLGERSYIELEYAESDGPGFGSTYSYDGGLILETDPATAGTGAARRFETLLELRELGLDLDGTFTAYGESRDAGFSTLDYSSLYDEKLWGFALDVQQSEKLRWVLYNDQYKNDDGKKERESGLELSYALNARDTVSVGIEQIDRDTSSETGTRTDVAVRFDRKQSADFSWFVLGQASAVTDGLRKNNRLGFGASYKINDKWAVEGEVSDGTLGAGGRVLATYRDGERRSRWFGYEFDPDSTIAGDELDGEDHGRFVIGARDQINDSLSFTGESSYDLLGEARTLTNSYGVEYQQSDYLTYSASFEKARLIDDTVGSEMDRWAISFGARYEDQKIAASGRLEYRQDDGMLNGTNRDGRTVALTAKARYQIDESQRFLFSLDAVDSDTDESSLPDSTYADAVIGYALRPVDNDKLNILAKYRFLYDKYGQDLDGTDARGPKQVSHVFSIDAEYDLNDHWTIGGKLGYRKSKSADVGSTIYADNDAWLGVFNARYHVVHNWDMLFELRQLNTVQANTRETGALVAVYRHFGNSFKAGIGYNFGSFSDDLTDLTYDDKGVFLNIIAKF
ncbi:MAG: hypothetical protein KDJ82_14395 [Rhodobacteraceae bacterium]|nr:hypothetical protein [Paracoccaceae bacterium]